VTKKEVVIEFQDRGSDFAKLDIIVNGRHYIYTGKTANILMDAMDKWAEIIEKKELGK
jgi:inactivated superfamily I helicase